MKTMNKLFNHWMVAAALLLATASCSTEQELTPSDHEEKGTEVTFQLALEDAADSRAANHDGSDDVYGRGTKVDNVIVEVYNPRNGNLVARSENNAIRNKKATVKFRLVSGQKYDFVFWAEKKGTDFYHTADLRNIKVNYEGAANDENRDAFTHAEPGLYINSGGINKDVYLKRPFAQLNIASTDEDHAIAEAANFACAGLKSTIRITGLADTYNALTGAITGSANTKLDFDFVPGYHGEVLKKVKLTDNGPEYDFKGYLSMNYFLASKKEIGQTINLEAEFDSQVSTDNEVGNIKISVTNVPVARNYRTNIIGNILTEQSVFNIIIDPDFDGDYVVGWDGKTVDEPNNSTTYGYEIKTPAHLAWVAQNVNEGTKTFEGEKVTLMDNIHLGNQDWTPIGTDDKKTFMGTFDGNGKYIYDFDVCSMDTPAGLFGSLAGTIKNLNIEQANIVGNENVGVVAGKVFPSGLVNDVTVKSSTVEAHHWAGGIAGFVYGSVTDCEVDHVTVTVTPEAVSRSIAYVNGDKAGGLIGYLGEDETAYVVSGNKVSNVEVTAYRDLGGLIGCAQAATVPNIKENEVTETTVIASRGYEPHDDSSKAINANEIIGRIEGTATLDGSNKASDVSIKE